MYMNPGDLFSPLFTIKFLVSNGISLSEASSLSFIFSETLNNPVLYGPMIRKAIDLIQMNIRVNELLTAHSFHIFFV